jgi:UDP-N-acetylmuramate--alanine ligase
LSLRYSGAVDVIEDYAHHPSEVEAGIAALREHYVDRPLRIVFQPHRSERVARYAADFGRALSAADEVIVIPTFNAWLDDAHLADPRAIIGAISGVPVRYCDFDFEELASELVSTARDGDVIAIMGAGTVTQLAPLLTAELATTG